MDFRNRSVLRASSLYSSSDRGPVLTLPFECEMQRLESRTLRSLRSKGLGRARRALPWPLLVCHVNELVSNEGKLFGLVIE